MATKYIFVTGGVVSGLGKGITAASLGRLLKTRGLKVASQKLDPYINVDPGTMSPLQHGGLGLRVPVRERRQQGSVPFDPKGVRGVGRKSEDRQFFQELRA